jgi:hypothetical protein
MPSEPARQRALARSGRAVDRDDFGTGGHERKDENKSPPPLAGEGEGGGCSVSDTEFSPSLTLPREAGEGTINRSCFIRAGCPRRARS